MKLFFFLFIFYLAFSQDYFSKFSQFTSNEKELINAQPYVFNKTTFNYSIISKQSSEFQSLSDSEFPSKHSVLLKDKYIIDFPLPTIYKIKILINPCKEKTGVVIPNCEAGKTENNYKDHYKIERGGPDLLVAWTISNTIIHCENEFKNKEFCGTFLEIHRPLDSTVIEEQQLTAYFINNFMFNYLSTKALCGGKYEVWFVFRTRIGSILQYVKPFFLEYPSCSCQLIKKLQNNYNC